MNSCILMATITSQPQLRYTQENQTPLSDMMVEFPSLKDSDPPSSLKAVAWGDLANEVSQNYQPGEQVILEGRLRMNTIERQEGFKEKRAEFTVSRIHRVGGGGNVPTPSSQANTSPNSGSENVVQFPQSQPSQPAEATSQDDSNLDDIPF